MKILTAAAMATASLLLLVSTAEAGPFSYICTIQSYHDPEGPAGGGDFLGELAMETTVAIDRRTGAIIHPLLGNASYRSTTVLDYGDESWSFRVLSQSGTTLDDPTGGNVVYAEVAEYAEGFQKPFIAIESGRAYLGYCE